MQTISEVVVLVGSLQTSQHGEPSLTYNAVAGGATWLTSRKDAAAAAAAHLDVDLELRPQEPSILVFALVRSSVGDGTITSQCYRFILRPNEGRLETVQSTEPAPRAPRSKRQRGNTTGYDTMGKARVEM